MNNLPFCVIKYICKYLSEVHSFKQTCKKYNTVPYNRLTIKEVQGKIPFTKTLNVSRSNVKNEDLFEGIEELDISSTNITYIPKTVKKLYAYNTRIQNENLFDGIRELDISYTEVTYIPKTVKKLIAWHTKIRIGNLLENFEDLSMNWANVTHNLKTVKKLYVFNAEKLITIYIPKSVKILNGKKI